MAKHTISQKYYLDIEVLHIEKDVIEIWQLGKQESNVIHVQKELIPELIKALNNQL